jgi:hypothetical protein
VLKKRSFNLNSACKAHKYSGKLMQIIQGRKFRPFLVPGGGVI